MAAVESELEAAVAAPASGGQDPTLGLPDELLVVILLLVSFEALWTGRCAGVCRRWRAVVESGPVQRRKRSGKWEAYAKGWIQPRTLSGHTNIVACLAAGPGGTICSGSYDCTVRVWRGVNEIRTLKGHTEWVCALAVGPDGTIYSGSYDKTIRVWSGDDGAHIRTLSGHADAVRCLAVGLNDKLYSESDDRTIRVWSTQDGAHIQTLEMDGGCVTALLSGLDGRVYSAASNDGTIRVWSGDDGAHLQTLEGHADGVTSMVWGPDGKLYSASYDGTIRVWSDGGGTIFKTTGSIMSSLVWVDGNLFAALRHTILVWSSDQLGPTDPPSHVLDGAVCGSRHLVGGSNGDLYAVAGSVLVKM
jgi:WD40 repeat protein